MNTLLTRCETEIDKLFIEQAVKNRNNITIYSYNKLSNHIYSKSLVGPNTNITSIVVPSEWKNYVMRASTNLKENYPSNNEVSYKRDYCMIKDADQLYLIGDFDESKKTRLLLKGREAWILEMFTNKLINNKKVPIPKLLPIYLYSQNNWFQLSGVTLKWLRIHRPPRPMGKYIAVGGEDVTSMLKLVVSTTFV